MADFSAGFDPARWPTLWADFAVDWRAEWFGNAVEPPTWYMSDDVLVEGLDGILFPSQLRPGGTRFTKALHDLRINCVYTTPMVRC